jgi:hypothetical protein
LELIFYLISWIISFTYNITEFDEVDNILDILKHVQPTWGEIFIEDGDWVHEQDGHEDDENLVGNYF